MYCRQGQAGQASSAMNALLRPLQFTKDGFQELETSGRGKCIVVSFRKTIFLEVLMILVVGDRFQSIHGNK